MGTVKSHSKSIGGKLYTCRTFPASEGLQILPRLVNIFGEDLIALVIAAATTEKGDDGKDPFDVIFESPEVLSKIVAKAADQATRVPGGWGVLHDLLKYTRCDSIMTGDIETEGSVYEEFDDHFAGDYMHLFEVCMWVVTESFGRP